jgi:RNA recognition motif-containing protein
MGSKLYVGNIPYTATADELRTLFAGSGRSVKSVEIVTDRDTGRSRGFAFVTMASDEEARTAAAELNGQQMGGRALTVNEAREREARPGGGGGGRGGFGGGGGRRGGGHGGGRGRDDY